MKLLTILVTLVLLSMTASFAAPAKNAKPVTGRWAVIKTNKGTIEFALYEKDAPITTKNFIDLANRKFTMA